MESSSSSRGPIARGICRWVVLNLCGRCIFGKSGRGHSQSPSHKRKSRCAPGGRNIARTWAYVALKKNAAAHRFARVCGLSDQHHPLKLFSPSPGPRPPRSLLPSIPPVPMRRGRAWGQSTPALRFPRACVCVPFERSRANDGCCCPFCLIGFGYAQATDGAGLVGGHQRPSSVDRATVINQRMHRFFVLLTPAVLFTPLDRDVRGASPTPKTPTMVSV